MASGCWSASRKRLALLVLAAAVAQLPAAAAAQEGGEAAEEAPPADEPPSEPPVTVDEVPSYAPPPPGGGEAPDVNAHLPSSSRASTDTSSSSDGFDLGRRGGAATVVHGSEAGAYTVSGQNVPSLHTAKRGDTLWDISKKYYNNPYMWPRVWSYNPQIQNPHWIYPGDHIRMRGDSGVRLSTGLDQKLVPPDTQFQRHLGYVLDGKHPEWGEVIGSPDDQMLLSENDEIYIKLYKDQEDLEVGALLTIFEPRKVKNLTPYPLVWVRGVAKVNRINHKNKMVRARIVESMDTIERGVKVGPIDRDIDVIKPLRNKKTVEAKIVGALYPYEFYAQGQTVFIDKGEEDGVEVGNRFFAVSRGDEWRLGLKNAGNMADKRAVTEDDRNAHVEDTPDKDEPRLYPAETYAELIVQRVRKKTATCVVIASIREIARGSIVVARQGY